MKKATLEQLQKYTEKIVEAAQHERILITRKGKPVVLIVSLGFKDEEDLHLEESREFWEMISERRKQPTVPLAEVEARLFGRRNGAKNANSQGRKKHRKTGS